MPDTVEPMRGTRKVKRGSEHPEVTESDYKVFAGRFADMLIHPDKPWLLEYLLAGGFTYSLKSVDDITIDILASAGRSYLLEKNLFDAALVGDREPIIAFFTKNFKQTKPSKEWLSAVLNALQANELRCSLNRPLEGLNCAAVEIPRFRCSNIRT